MILIDCGNSQLKAQYWQKGALSASYAGPYDAGWSDHFSVWLGDRAAAHAYLASVLDADRQSKLERVLTQHFGSTVTRYASEAQALGVSNGYQQPAQLGVDRWLALIGAAQLVDGDCIVIDAGSAITLDLLRQDGQHLGGGILPGFNTSVEDFKQIFAYIDFSDPEIVETDNPGGSTAAAIQIDYAQSSIEVLPGLVNRWISRLEENATLLLTGGDAYRVQRELTQPVRHIPDLVFQGMHRLATS